MTRSTFLILALTLFASCVPSDTRCLVPRVQADTTQAEDEVIALPHGDTVRIEKEDIKVFITYDEVPCSEALDWETSHPRGP